MRTLSHVLGVFATVMLVATVGSVSSGAWTVASAANPSVAPVPDRGLIHRDQGQAPATGERYPWSSCSPAVEAPTRDGPIQEPAA